VTADYDNQTAQQKEKTMTTTIDHPPSSSERHPPSWFARSLSLGYGAIAYAAFFATFLYAIGFVSGYLVPKTIDSGEAWSTLSVAACDLALLGLFALQHSGMARRGFKRIFKGVASPVIERSTYVLCATLVLDLLLYYWQPIPDIAWRIVSPDLASAVNILQFVGWLIALVSTFLISHFELFGLKQVAHNFVGHPLPEASFKAPALYRFVRHPIYLGFIIAFWAAPTMTMGRLLFAVVTTAYIFVGIALEERDLIATFGDQYRLYRERVAMLFPGVL
jgi:protein-S-isoprenylcysteine O-methyltransferase Ste14